MAIQSSINQAIHSISQLSALGKIGKETETSTELALASASDKALKRVEEIRNAKMSQDKVVNTFRQMWGLPPRQPKRMGEFRL